MDSMIPGLSRQNLREMQREIAKFPLPKFREWLMHFADECQYQGAVAERALLLEAVHREYGFGKKRLGRILDKCEEVKGAGSNGKKD